MTDRCSLQSLKISWRTTYVKFFQSFEQISAWLISAALIAILFLLVVLPLAAVIVASLLTALPFSGSETTWTLHNYIAIWSPATWDAILNTLVVAVGGTFISMLIGGVLAWLAARSDTPAKPLIYAIGISPLFMSLVVVAMTWSFIASGRTGYLNIIAADLGLPFHIEAQSLAGITVIQGLYYAPYAFLILFNALSLINPDVEEAAEMHGARNFVILQRITFPLVRPALIGSTILVFVAAIEDFPVPAILGGPVGIETLSVHIYKLFSRAPSEPNQAAAVSVLLTVIVFALIWFQRAALRGKDYRTITGKGRRQKLTELGLFRWPAFAFAAIYGFVTLVLPLLSLLEGALRSSLYVPNSASLIDFSQMSFQRVIQTLNNAAFHSGVINSVIAATSTAIIGTTLYFVLAYTALRTRMPGRGLIEYLVVIPLALPSLVLGLGLLWTWLALPFPIYGTMTLLVIAFVARFLPQGYRALSGSIVQVHDELEEAALMAGASRFTAIWRVTLPLLKGSVASAAILTAILSIRELTVSLFLYTTNTKVLSIVIFEAYDNGNWATVATMSFIYTTVLLILIITARRWITPPL